MGSRYRMMRLIAAGVLIAAAGAVFALFAPVAAPEPVAQAKASRYPWINTWGVEYYRAQGRTLREDAEHFDVHMSPENVQGLKEMAPKSIAVLYALWREQYASSEPGAMKERRKIREWTSANRRSAEGFYCHYGSDVTIKGKNPKTREEEFVAITGWDDRNDANHDGIRDLPADHGFATITGANFIQDASRNWEKDQWAGATLVDRNGESYRVTGNSKDRLALAAGKPPKGRYSLSARGSPNPRATARTKEQSRVRSFIWEDYAYAMNLGSREYRDFRVYDARKIILEGDKAWDEAANTLWDGFMVDNAQPEFPWPAIVDGREIILEYPNKGRWKVDQVDLIKAVRNALGQDKLVIGNTGSYDYPEAADAGGGQHQEQYVAFVNEHGPKQWNYWKRQSDKRIYSLVLPTWDCYPKDPERERMHCLAFHYMGQQPYIYLGFRGFGYREVLAREKSAEDWLPASAVDVGRPVDPMYKPASSGKDPTGRKYHIYTRRYSKALVVCRPKEEWDWDDYGDCTAVSFDLPFYKTGSGRSNLYQPLHADGSLGAAVSKVRLRNPESFILFPASTYPQSTRLFQQHRR